MVCVLCLISRVGLVLRVAIIGTVILISCERLKEIHTDGDILSRDTDRCEIAAS